MPDLSAAEFTLLQGAHLFAPEDRGICDVLLANGKIIAVGAGIPGDIVPDCTVINLSGRMLCPGFIDQHVHLIGGGGEGPTTRTPEVSLSRLTEAGITTVVGLLGTDSVSRHPASLLAKTRALNEEDHRLDAHGRLSRSVADHYWLGRKRRRADRPRHWREMRSLRPPFRRAQRNQLASMAAESRVGGLLGANPCQRFSYGQQQKGYSRCMTSRKTATCRSVNCCLPTSTVANLFSSRRWRLRLKAA